MMKLPPMLYSHRKALKDPLIIPPALDRVMRAIEDIKGTGILVGGCVRDHLLGHQPKDFDIEVYGIDLPLLEKTLRKHFNVIAVGKAFGIFKVVVWDNGENHTYDVALPRSENKEGFGHKGFIVSTNAFMPFEEAAKRRDFTINAMAIDVRSNELLDAYNGLEHLEKRILKHVSEAFCEDPLRVLRGAQFCARFDLVMDESTIELCQKLNQELFLLSPERIFFEMKKLLFAFKPSLGLNVLRETKALNLFPELLAMIDCPQEPQWHPEGDVWVHTLMVIDEAAKLIRQSGLKEEEKLIIMAASLCHDIGKPPTTKHIDGLIRSLAHDEAGVLLTKNMLSRIAFPPKYIDDVCALVREHLKPFQLYKVRDNISDGAIKRLALRVNVDHLLYVSRADFLGRTTPEALSGDDPSYHWLKEKMQNLLGEEKKPKPLLLGRHLIEAGFKPGPEFKKILDRAFEAQLDGNFDTIESALAWFKEHYITKKS